MQSKKKFAKLNKPKPHREAMLKNMLCSLIQYESIKTTKARANALTSFAERVINRAKSNDLAAKKYVSGILPSSLAYQKVFDVLVERYKDRNGGYTVRLLENNRTGDNSKMARVSLVVEEPKKEPIKEKIKTKETKVKKAVTAKKTSAEKVISKKKPVKKVAKN